MTTKKKPAEEGGVNLALIITPMLDMAFQILAFFIMTYHPSSFEGHIDGDLLPPSLFATKGPKSDPTKPDDLPAMDIEPEFQDVLTVIVKSVPGGKSGGDGEPNRIQLKRPEAPDAKIISDTDTQWDDALKKLRTELKQILEEPGAVKANIKIDGDGDLKHQYMMETYDACKLAGYQRISFVAPAPSRPK